MSIGRIVFSVDCQQRLKNVILRKTRSKFREAHSPRLTPLHETHHISVNFANIFIKFGENILETHVFQKNVKIK